MGDNICHEVKAIFSRGSTPQAVQMQQGRWSAFLSQAQKENRGPCKEPIAGFTRGDFSNALKCKCLDLHSCYICLMLFLCVGCSEKPPVLLLTAKEVWWTGFPPVISAECQWGFSLLGTVVEHHAAAWNLPLSLDLSVYCYTCAKPKDF